MLLSWRETKMAARLWYTKVSWLIQKDWRPAIYKVRIHCHLAENTNLSVSQSFTSFKNTIISNTFVKKHRESLNKNQEQRETLIYPPTWRSFTIWQNTQPCWYFREREIWRKCNSPSPQASWWATWLGILGARVLRNKLTFQDIPSMNSFRASVW